MSVYMCKRTFPLLGGTLRRTAHKHYKLNSRTTNNYCTANIAVTTSDQFSVRTRNLYQLQADWAVYRRKNTRVAGTAAFSTTAPKDGSRKYFTKSHEYIKLDETGKIATLGLSCNAIEELGEIAFVEMPSVGTAAKRGEVIATVASIKAVGDVYSPIDGTVIAVNEEMESDTTKISEDAENSGWIIKIEMSSEKLPGGFLTREEYEKHCADEKLGVE